MHRTPSLRCRFPGTPRSFPELRIAGRRTSTPKGPVFFEKMGGGLHSPFPPPVRGGLFGEQWCLVVVGQFELSEPKGLSRDQTSQSMIVLHTTGSGLPRPRAKAETMAD